jgi:type VI secretion system protein ImpK
MASGAPKPSSNVELQRLVAGINPLLGAANVLLALIPQLRATTRHADPARLRQQLLEHVREFEDGARAAAVPRTKISAARYLLCTFIDEVVGGTPWGAEGVWAQSNLLQAFHEERSGGDKAFRLLERLGEDVAANTDLLELFYVCIALGFEGRYAGKPEGRAQLDAIAARLIQVLRPKADAQASRSLSPRWTGVRSEPRRPTNLMPVWGVASLGGALVVGAIVFFGARLDARSDPAFRQILQAAASVRVDPARVEAGGVPARPRLAVALQADAGARALEVIDQPMRSIVTVAADSLFIAGTAQVDPERRALLARIAQSIIPVPGQVAVIGHTDDRPVNSLQFPSNWHLAREQANAVMAVLVQNGLAAARMRAEGRADAEPRDRGSTPAARARNRRIEIEVQLPRPDAVAAATQHAK